MAWTNTNATGDTATATWANETRAAITVKDGIVTTNSTTGTSVTLVSAFASVSDYMVFLTWQEDPGTGSGDLYVVKSVGSFLIKNSGATTGKNVAYRVVTKVTLP